MKLPSWVREIDRLRQRRHERPNGFWLSRDSVSKLTIERGKDCCFVCSA
jgi:hypothetical protein